MFIVVFWWPATSIKSFRKLNENDESKSSASSQATTPVIKEENLQEPESKRGIYN